MKYLILGLEKSLGQQDCDHAVTRVKTLTGVFSVQTTTQHNHRINLEDNAAPDQVIADAKLITGVKHVEKPIPHY